MAVAECAFGPQCRHFGSAFECLTYVASGVLVVLAGFLFAARLGGASNDTGAGLEIMALTAAVLGGNRLGGGSGSAAKAVLGVVIVMIIVNGLVQLGSQSGTQSLILGVILLLAVAIDVRWLKNRYKVLAKVYVSPTFLRLPETFGTDRESSSPYALNDKLRDCVADWPRSGRRPGRRHPRRQRQPLCRNPHRRHRSLSGA